MPFYTSSATSGPCVDVCIPLFSYGPQYPSLPLCLTYKQIPPVIPLSPSPIHLLPHSQSLGHAWSLPVHPTIDRTPRTEGCGGGSSSPWWAAPWCWRALPPQGRAGESKTFVRSIDARHIGMTTVRTGGGQTGKVGRKVRACCELTIGHSSKEGAVGQCAAHRQARAGWATSGTCQ